MIQRSNRIRSPLYIPFPHLNPSSSSRRFSAHSLPLRAAARLSDRREDGTSIAMRSVGYGVLLELHLSDLCARILPAAVQEVRGDRAGGPGELRQGIRSPCCHRRRRRPEQGNDQALFYMILFLFVFWRRSRELLVSLVAENFFIPIAHCEKCRCVLMMDAHDEIAIGLG